MTTSSATARSIMPVLALRLSRPRAALSAVNDNGEPLRDGTVLRDALKLFAEHGLGAAGEARARAERAFFAKDSTAYRRWLAICRTLDRRMAACIAARVANSPR